MPPAGLFHQAKGSAIFLLLLLILHPPCTAQRITVDRDVVVKGSVPVPGFFIANITSAGRSIFDNAFQRVNALRLSDIAWSLRTSTGFDQCLQAVRGIRSSAQYWSARTDNPIFEINGMPRWLSSSSDTTRLDETWRAYHVVPPADYAVWDSLMTRISEIVSTWGVTPRFEIWNEPDLDLYWRSSESDWIELYRHTAQALKAGDPSCMVGGPAVNGWMNGIGAGRPSIYGWWPDSVAERTSLIAHLIDSCAVHSTPLDFVSFHAFGGYPEIITNGYTFLRKKLDRTALNGARIYLTEYNLSGSFREKPVHAPFLIRAVTAITAAGVDAHTISSFQDFTFNPADEFWGDYGCVSRSGLVKPALSALYLLYHAAREGRRINASCDEPVTVLAFTDDRMIRLLVAHEVFPPVLEAYEELLWGGHGINTIDLALAGYTSWEEIEEVMKGVAPPRGSSVIQQAFLAARRRFEWATLRRDAPATFQFHIGNLAGTRNATMVVLDSTSNNMVFRHDSLLAEGYANTEAVAYLSSSQSLESTRIAIRDSLFQVTLRPNSVLYVGIPLDLSGVDHSPSGAQVPVAVYPNPFTSSTVIQYTLDTEEDVFLEIRDLLGRRLMVLDEGRMARGVHTVRFDASLLPAGIYFCRLAAGGTVEWRRLIRAR